MFPLFCFILRFTHKKIHLWPAKPKRVIIVITWRYEYELRYNLERRKKRNWANSCPLWLKWIELSLALCKWKHKLVGKWRLSCGSGGHSERVAKFDYARAVGTEEERERERGRSMAACSPANYTFPCHFVCRATALVGKLHYTASLQPYSCTWVQTKTQQGTQRHRGCCEFGNIFSADLLPAEQNSNWNWLGAGHCFLGSVEFIYILAVI